MAIRKYTNGAWVPTGRKYGTETETITSLPAQIIGDGQPITSCQISGNTVKNGIPSPDTPVDVVGCGVRTGNLFDKSTVKKGYYVNDVNGGIEPGGTSLNASDYIYIGGASKVCIENQPANRWGAFYDSAKAYVSGFTAYGNVTVPVNAVYVRITVQSASLNTMMLNTGSTPLPYEPYGYKLHLTIGGTEYPIYLGQVESTRKIRKLVLTGESDVDKIFAFDGLIYVQNSGMLAESIAPFCNCLIGTDLPVASAPMNCVKQGPVFNQTLHAALFFKLDGITTKTGFLDFLSTMNSAGRPVTVWYVLATPETAVVNEPLHKIGDYADTVSATNIPTTGTAEQFDIQTTLKPSEVQLTYHGWHEHADTKYTE